MTDATRRKLQIPNWYSPYLEKHRIYELFHELCRELVIQMPADHILFLKEILYRASCSRYVPRVILLAPPHVNINEVSKLLAEKSKATIITEKRILNVVEDNYHRPKAHHLTRMLGETIRQDDIYYTGWILPDYPKNKKEASYMQRAGILPTHVFHLIPSYAPPLFELSTNEDDTWSIYRRAVLGIREVFKSHLKEIHTNNKCIEEVVDNIIELLSIRKRYNAPIIPRICILGPRGSGRKTQAKILVQKFNLIHVDFEKLLCQEWISESHLGHKLRVCRDRVGYNSVLLTAVIHKRMLQIDCLEHGYVLTGFPNTLEDFKNLDMIDTPPNRVLFLECDLNICRERVLNRKTDMNTGNIIHIPENSQLQNDPKLNVHPRDKEALVNSELNYYCKHYNALRKYVGRNSSVVDACQIEQWVSETITAIIMRPLPAGETRCGLSSTALSEHSIEVSDEQDDDEPSCSCPPCKRSDDSETKQDITSDRSSSDDHIDPNVCKKYR